MATRLAPRGPAKGRRLQDPFAVTGLVVPADWDTDDNVALVSILTDDEGEYLVVADKKGRELVWHIHKRVAAIGQVFRNDNGEQVLRVEAFSVLHS